MNLAQLGGIETEASSLKKMVWKETGYETEPQRGTGWTPTGTESISSLLTLNLTSFHHSFELLVTVYRNYDQTAMPIIDSLLWVMGR